MGMRKLRLNPYQQGQLDALCGPYAVVNALRIVFPWMSKAECAYLLARCIEELEFSAAALWFIRVRRQPVGHEPSNQ